MFLLDVSATRDCYIIHPCLHLLLVLHLDVQLISWKSWRILVWSFSATFGGVLSILTLGPPLQIWHRCFCTVYWPLGYGLVPCRPYPLVSCTPPWYAVLSQGPFCTVFSRGPVLHGKPNWSCAAAINASVQSVNQAFSSHCYVFLLLSTSSVC